MRDFEDEEESDQKSFEIPKNLRIQVAKNKVNWVIIISNVLLFVLFFRLFLSQSLNLILDDSSIDVNLSHFMERNSKDDNHRTSTNLTAIYQSHRNKRYLCQILKNKNCKSYFIADSVDLFWLIAPIYAFNLESDVLIIQKHILFKSYVESIGLHLITIEAIRDPNQNISNSKEAKKFLCTKPDNEPYDIQVYYHNVSYIRENLLNVAIRKLDKLAPWEYAAWVDAHQFFDNPYWWEESIYKAEKYGTVQMFTYLHVLHPNNQTWWSTESIIHRSLYTYSYLDVSNIAYGNAFVISRHNYYAIGYIYDECIATCCDCAYVLGTFPPEISWNYKYKNYFNTFQPWINNARKALKYSRSYIRGDLFHFFHGKWFPYLLLMDAIENSGFNPARDIQRDENFSIIITNKQISAAQERIIFDSKLRP